MRKTMFLTKEQFTKLECDAHAFLEVERLTRKHMNEVQPPLMSPKYISLATTIMTNLGMGFELKLKAIHYKATGFIPWEHEFVKIYDSLDAGGVKARLAEIYKECLEATPDKSIVNTYKRSKEQPSPIPSPQIRDFREFLSYLDEIGLYNQRYSFEDFSSREWWKEIQPAFLTQLINRITEFTNSLPEPSSS